MLTYKSLGFAYMDEDLSIKIVAVVEDNPSKNIFVNYLDYLDKPYLPYPCTRRIDAVYYHYPTNSLVVHTYSVPEYNDYYKIIAYLKLGYYFGDWDWTYKDDEFHDEMVREFECDSSQGIF